MSQNLFFYNYFHSGSYTPSGENQVVKTSQNSLSIHVGPMKRVRTKKMKKVLNGLFGHILNSCLVQDINLLELSIQGSQCFVNIIQSFTSDLELFA